MPRSYLTLPWGQVHVRRAGTPGGARLVLVHQSPLSSVTYAPVLDALGEHADVLAPDNPGYGASDPAPEGWGIDDYARGLWAVIDAAGDGPVVLVGQHTGAIVATEAAAQRPDDVRALVLQGLPLYTDAERHQRLTEYAPPYVPALDGSHLAFIWDRLTGLYPETDVDLRTRLVGDYVATGPDYGKAYRAVFRHDLGPALDRVAAADLPVRIVCGEGDLVRHHHPRVLDRVPGATERTIAGAGDFAAHERPDELVAELVTVLEETA